MKKQNKSTNTIVSLFTGKRIIIALLLIMALLTATACGGSLNAPKNGTYRSNEGLLSQTWTFSGNKVTLSAGGGLISTTGTYSISGDRLTIKSSLFGVETTTGYMITEITSNSFFIDGTKFIKQ